MCDDFDAEGERVWSAKGPLHFVCWDSLDGVIFSAQNREGEAGAKVGREGRRADPIGWRRLARVEGEDLAEGLVETVALDGLDAESAIELSHDFVDRRTHPREGNRRGGDASLAESTDEGLSSKL
jgi:hypothetical protein